MPMNVIASRVHYVTKISMLIFLGENRLQQQFSVWLLGSCYTCEDFIWHRYTGVGTVCHRSPWSWVPCTVTVLVSPSPQWSSTGAWGVGWGWGINSAGAHALYIYFVALIICSPGTLRTCPNWSVSIVNVLLLTVQTTYLHFPLYLDCSIAKGMVCMIIMVCGSKYVDLYKYYVLVRSKQLYSQVSHTIKNYISKCHLWSQSWKLLDMWGCDQLVCLFKQFVGGIAGK